MTKTAATAVAERAIRSEERDGARMLEVMRHALGVQKRNGKYGQGGFRNYFCADVGGMDEQVWWTLVGLGVAKPGLLINDGASQIFLVTGAGKRLVRAVTFKGSKEK